MKSTFRQFGVFGLSLALMALAAVVTTAAAPDDIATAKVGEKAPAFTLKDTKGKDVKLADFAGKIVVLEWINPDCPYVVGAYNSGSIPNAYNKVKEIDSNIVWLAINSGHNSTVERNDTWIKQKELKYPILLDPEGKVGHSYDAKRTPHMFVIDKTGVLRYHGAIDDNQLGDKKGDDITNYVVNAVKQISAGETVSPDHVPAYGCTVKYKK